MFTRNSLRKLRISATPNHTKASRKMYNPDRYVLRAMQMDMYKKNLAVLFARAGVQVDPSLIKP